MSEDFLSEGRVVPPNFGPLRGSNANSRITGPCGDKCSSRQNHGTNGATVADHDWQDELLRARQRERKARAILRVPENAGQDAIRQAFGKIARERHPDGKPGDERSAWRFDIACRAYRLLMDGEDFAELDSLDLSGNAPANTEYNLNNTWGYWCWWRDTYLGEKK